LRNCIDLLAVHGARRSSPGSTADCPSFGCCTFINRRKWADLRFVAPRENAKDAGDGLLYTRIVAISYRGQLLEIMFRNPRIPLER